MPTLLERLRDALAPRYEIEAEVASGGMPPGYRADDPSNGRDGAGKLHRPDMPTPPAEARYHR